MLCGMFVWKDRECFFQDVLLPELFGKWYTSTSYRSIKQFLSTESTAVEKSSCASHFRPLASLDFFLRQISPEGAPPAANWSVHTRCCCANAHATIPFTTHAQAMNLESVATPVS